MDKAGSHETGHAACAVADQSLFVLRKKPAQIDARWKGLATSAEQINCINKRPLSGNALGRTAVIASWCTTGQLNDCPLSAIPLALAPAFYMPEQKPPPSRPRSLSVCLERENEHRRARNGNKEGKPSGHEPTFR